MSDYIENMKKLLIKNVPTGIKMLFNDHNAGNIVATYLLGRVFYDCLYIEPDIDKAIELWTAGEKRGSLDCEKSLGDCYFYGKGFKEDNQKAFNNVF